jgi:hypothetical protein
MCTCYYIEVPYDLATSGGEDLYVVFADCNGQADSAIALNQPNINLGSSFAFYICSSISPTFKYGYFGTSVFIEGSTVTDTGKYVLIIIVVILQSLLSHPQLHHKLLQILQVKLRQ